MINFTHTLKLDEGLQLAFTTGATAGAILRVADTNHDEAEVPALESVLTVDELTELRTLLGTLLKQVNKNTSSSTPS